MNEDMGRVRASQLRRLRDERFGGKNVRLGEALEIAPDYLGRVINGKKTIAEKACRSIEKKLGLPDKWMDSEAGEPLEPQPLLNAERLYQCFQAVDAWLVKHRQQAPLEERVESVCYLYEMFLGQEADLAKMVTWLDRWSVFHGKH